jgi:amphi-Trp domain-containing protein
LSGASLKKEDIEMSKNEVEFKAVMPMEQLKTYLKDLLASLDDGIICVQSGGEYVTLEPKDMVKVEVEAKVKKEKAKLNLELTWRNEMDLKGDASLLKISSVVPEPPAEEPVADSPAENAAAPNDAGEDDKAEELRHGE